MQCQSSLATFSTLIRNAAGAYSLFLFSAFAYQTRRRTFFGRYIYRGSPSINCSNSRVKFTLQIALVALPVLHNCAQSRKYKRSTDVYIYVGEPVSARRKRSACAVRKTSHVNFLNLPSDPWEKSTNLIIFPCTHLDSFPCDGLCSRCRRIYPRLFFLFLFV